MSPADDVLEMKTLSTQLVERLAGKGAQLQTQIGVMLKVFGDRITENRAKEFIKGEARRVDAWEKEHAARRLAELKRLERIQRDNEHILWLESEIARHRASGTEFRGSHVDGLEHFLRVARSSSGAVELSEAATETKGE